MYIPASGAFLQDGRFHHGRHNTNAKESMLNSHIKFQSIKQMVGHAPYCDNYQCSIFTFSFVREGTGLQ